MYIEMLQVFQELSLRPGRAFWYNKTYKIYITQLYFFLSIIFFTNEYCPPFRIWFIFKKAGYIFSMETVCTGRSVVLSLEATKRA